MIHISCATIRVRFTANKLLTRICSAPPHTLNVMATTFNIKYILTITSYNMSYLLYSKANKNKYQPKSILDKIDYNIPSSFGYF